MVAAHGHSSLGAQRWLNLGPIHQFQPSELMKVGLVLALARFYHGLSARNAKFSFWLLIPAILIAAPAALVMKEPDLGTALLICATGAAMMILAGLDLRVVGVGAALAAAVVPLSTSYALAEAIGVERSVSRSFREAPLFLGLFTAQIVVGAVVTLTPINLISLLIGTQVIEGLVTPITLCFIVTLANRKSVLGKWVNGPVLKTVSWVVTAVVGSMAILLVVVTVLPALGIK